jgi:hypothetical protein
MDDQLQELINLQKEQNRLLKKYLWRFRFSLLSLLVLTTITAAGLGLLVYQSQSSVNAIPPTTTSATWTSYPPSQGTLTFNTDTTDLFKAIDQTPADDTSKSQ